MLSEENMASLEGDKLSVSIESPAKDIAVIRDREEKIRILKERQNEERQRKLEELKAQALATQKYREQKEEERKRRIDELRSKDNDRRLQVEERKKAIQEAERERKEYIMRKNHEREARMETKRRNERGSISFAFGSSTPRLLDPAELGSVMNSSYWGHRRSTSITNVACTGAPLSRRSSERELCEAPKKRATSAGGLDRQNEGRAVSMSRLDQLAQPVRRNGEHIKALIERERRQHTENTMSVSSSPLFSANNSTGGSPKSTTTAKLMSRSMTHLAAGTKYGNKQSANNRGKGATITTTTVQSTNARGGSGGRGGGGSLRKSDASRSMSQLSTTATTTTSTTTISVKTTKHDKHDKHGEFSATSSFCSTGSRSGEVTPGGSLSTSRPGSAMSTSTNASGVIHRRPISLAKKPRPASIAVTGVSSQEAEMNKLRRDRPPVPKPHNRKSMMSQSMTMSSPARSIDEANAVAATKKRVVPTPRKSMTPRATTPTQSVDTLTTKTLQQQHHKSTPQKVVAVEPPKVVSEKPITTATAATTQVTTTSEQSQTTTTTTNGTEQIITVESTTTVVAAEQLNDAANTVIDETSQLLLAQDQHHNDMASVSQDNSVSENGVTVMESVPQSKEDAAIPVETAKDLLADMGADMMTASMIAKSRINTEEEAKAALAERRRMARVEAERQAELERQRVEAEEAAELQRLAEEEERQRCLEEEMNRLALEQRKAEEERLLLAIEETKKRDEAEKLRKEDEERQKIEREETEKKAREEAEKQRIEVAERLKREEKEREERRKRVEAIMLRTRGKGGSTNSTPNNTPSKNNGGGDDATKSIDKSEDDNNKESDGNEKSDVTKSTTELIGTTDKVSADLNEYENSVKDKEAALMNSFTNLLDSKQQTPLIDTQGSQNLTKMQATNGDNIDAVNRSNEKFLISNGNGHNNLNNLIEQPVTDVTNNLVDVIENKTATHEPALDQLIDFNIESTQQIVDAVNFNNNSLLTTAPLVTSENKELSLL